VHLEFVVQGQFYASHGVIDETIVRRLLQSVSFCNCRSLKGHDGLKSCKYWGYYDCWGAWHVYS